MMDVSPQDENVVYLGTPSNGIQFSLNGGTTWNQLSIVTIPAGTIGMGNLVKFDPSDGTGNTFYASSYGTGYYKCTTARTSPSCVPINSAGMPTTHKDLHVDPLGTVWVADNIAAGNGGNVYRYLSGTWTTQLSNANYTSVAVDPASTSNVYALQDNGSLTYSINGQVGSPTWTGAMTQPQTNSTGTAVNSTIIPWQQWSADNFLSANQLVFDPSQTHVLYMGNGDGVYKITPPTAGSAVIIWNADETAGIENLDLTNGIALPGGGLGFSAQDRPLWFTTNQPAYPSRYFPNGGNGSSTPIKWGMNLCGNAAANTYAGINLSDGLTVSTTGFAGTYSVSGQTGLPGGSAAGLCAILTSANWIWMPSNGQPFFTNNSGTSWGACTFGGGKTAAGGGWVTLAQDSTAPGTIVIYNDGSGGTNGVGAKGFWKSTLTSSCAFVQQSTTTPDGQGVKLRAVPGLACNFLFASQSDPGSALPNSGNGYLTTDCGATFSAAISNLTSMLAFGFGAANPAKNGFPALYCQCYGNDGSGSKFGFYEVDNLNTVTAPFITNLDAAQGGYPAGNFDFPVFVVGDLVTYGTVYGGFSQSGGFYRTLR